MSRVIHVEGLSKKFALHHLAAGENYSTFRDALTTGLSKASKNLLHRQKDQDKETNEEFWALQDIGFSIQNGEKVGIIGRNGAGKSTLLKILSRIIEPTRGEIRIRGRVASLLEVGTGFHPELTGRENIYFNGAILGMTKSEIQSRFDDIVEFAEVEKFLDTPVKHYSSGMYVRLGFAVAAHLEPEILILDEVLAVGDARFQKKCLGKLQDIGREGRTILLVSHNMSSILQFTNRILLLNRGRIAFDGDSSTGTSEYLKLNNETNSTCNLATNVPWVNINAISFNQAAMDKGFNKAIPFTLELELQNDVRDLTVTFGITNSIDARLITAKTQIPCISPETSKIMLELPNHRLLPGTYFVNINLSTPKEIIFFMEKAISFELIADNIDDPLLLAHATKGKDRHGAYCPLEWHS